MINFKSGDYRACPARWLALIQKKTGLSTADLALVYCTRVEMTKKIQRSTLEFQIAKCGTNLTNLTDC
jgi:hypothetical protein